MSYNSMLRMGDMIVSSAMIIFLYFSTLLPYSRAFYTDVMHIMIFSACFLLDVALFCSIGSAFITYPISTIRSTRGQTVSVAIESSADTNAPIIPTNLQSARGVDYVSLATMLATGDFKSADQFTRDNLIVISGAADAGRNFVYWTEVGIIPAVDLATMERLWLQFSEGKFGYSVQRRIWEVNDGNFDNFIRQVGWTKMDNGIERKLKWFGASEFIYDLDKAPKGHLPLTSALRGTQLLKQLMEHPVWTQYDWKNYDKLKWD